MRGKFISFEGGEGAGKSTQARMLRDQLESRGRTVLLTREPGGSPGAEEIRKLLVEGEPKGQRMGWMRLKRGHQALLPANTAYQFRAAQPAVIILQTCKGDLSVEKWADICQAA